jgi:FkbM family methyltransferase
MAFLLHLLRDGDLFIDVGANSGSYSILAGKVIGCNVIAVEPLKEAYLRLIKNLELNDISTNVKPLIMGISNHTGRDLFTCDHDAMNHIVTLATDQKVEEVSVTSLDILLENECPSLIKIDVEGWENAVIDGATSVLSNP